MFNTAFIIGLADKETRVTNGYASDVVTHVRETRLTNLFSNILIGKVATTRSMTNYVFILCRNQSGISPIHSPLHSKGSARRSLPLHGSHGSLRQSDVREGVALVHGAGRLSSQPLHQAGASKEDSHLYLSPAGGFADPLCVWIRKVAIHEDDISHRVGMLLAHQVSPPDIS